jgi:hypothetical protein
MVENWNSFLYLVGTILLAAGMLLLLPSFEMRSWGLWMVLVGFAVIVVVNLHDLHAHLVGIDYDFSLLSMDTQWWMVELAVPTVHAIGSILLCIATFLLIRVNAGSYDQSEYKLKLTQAFRLVISGSALWLLGSIHNAFQVYEKANARVQLLQMATSLPFLVSSELLLLSGILPLQISNFVHGRKLMDIAIWLALAASVLLVVAALLNAFRVVFLQQADRVGGHLEILRGGAEDRLRSFRANSEPLLSSTNKSQADIESHQAEVQPYRGPVVPSEPLPR